MENRITGYSGLHWAFGFLSLLPMLFFQNCSDVSFTSQELASKTSGGKGTLYSETFLTDSKAAQPIDMVWVVDNSGSMNQEAAHVRQNLQAFIQTVNQEVHINVALISRVGSSGADVSVPEVLNSPDHMAIDQVISSKNSLSMLDEKIPLLQSMFFRPNSKKVFVFVTDDESSLLADEFARRLKDHGISDYKTFGFIGFATRSESPCMARHGEQYLLLAQATSGSVFNICETDWRPHFGALAKQVVKAAQTAFPLEKVNISGIEWVKVNGKIISSANYRLEEGELKIDSKLLRATGNYTISLEYRYL